MTEYAQHLLSWVNAHPHWACVLLFLVSMLDAIFLVGAFVPAGIVLFAMGALVPLGTLDLATLIVVAAAGAVLGDAFSFWLGRRYHEHLFDLAIFRRYPEVVANGRLFFHRHGGKSVVLARFLGPVRAITPALAGASGMRAWLFLVTDGLAAIGWALAYILPGVVFGASLGLAAEVAGRLAVLLLVLVIVVWVGIWLTLFTVRYLQGHTQRMVGAMLDWSRRHRRLGKFGAALADPDQPETPVLVVLAALLLAIGGSWLYLWAAPGLHRYPTPVDAAVFQTLRDLHAPWGIELAQLLLQLGEWPVYGPLAAVAFIALLVARKARAAAHWVAAVGFGAVISIGLYLVPTLPPPFEFFETPMPEGYSARDLVLCVIIYAFLPVLLATGRPLPVRVLFYGASIVVLMLITLARLYLGAQWYTLALFSIIIGAVWAALLGFGYRRHHPEVIDAPRFLVPIVVVFLGAAAWQWSGARSDAAEGEAPAAFASLAAGDWLAQGWRVLPQQRQDMAGRPKQPLNLQWAGTLPAIEARLAAAGWQPVTRANGINTLRWLTASTPIEELPVLPQVHAGRHQALVMRLPVDAQRQLLIRLWPSGYQLDDGAPLWVGSVALQRARSYYRFLRYPVSDGEPAIEPLMAPLADVLLRRADAVWLLKS